MAPSGKYDIVLYGATGFTGKLCVSYIRNTYGSSIKWAIGGRSESRVQEVADTLGGGLCDVIIADSTDERALLEMVKKVRNGDSWRHGARRRHKGFDSVFFVL